MVSAEMFVAYVYIPIELLLLCFRGVHSAVAYAPDAPGWCACQYVSPSQSGFLSSLLWKW